MTPRRQQRYKVAGASIVVALMAYATYKYWTVSENGSTSAQKQESGGDTTEYELRPKQQLSTSIALVITPAILDKLKEYNSNQENQIDIVTYLKMYPNLAVVLWPGLQIEDLENYFVVGPPIRNRILRVEKMESISIILRHLNKDLNLVVEGIETRGLKNIITLKEKLFVEYI